MVLKAGQDRIGERKGEGKGKGKREGKREGKGEGKGKERGKEGGRKAQVRNLQRWSGRALVGDVKSGARKREGLKVMLRLQPRWLEKYGAP